MPLENDREKLRRLLVENSVRHGHFRLASGKETNVYVDAKLTTCHPEGTKLVGKVFLQAIRSQGWKPAAVGGLIIGAAPIVVAIANQSVDPIYAFLVRKEAKKHGSQKFIEGLEHTQGLQVVIVDDVCTTGASTADAIENSRKSGMVVLGALCLVDRETGAREMLMSEFGCPFLSIFTLSELLSMEEQNKREATEVLAL